MDKQTFGIGVLSVTAAILLVGTLIGNTAVGQQVGGSTGSGLTIKDRDFSLLTAPTQNSGETLFVLDNRTGRVAIYSYDPVTRSVLPRVFGDMATLFPPPPTPGR